MEKMPDRDPVPAPPMGAVLHAIRAFLEWGEQEYGKAQQGYFSGSGFAARILREHLAVLERAASDPVPAPPVETLQLHRCKTCGTAWLLWPSSVHGGGWNLLDKYQRPGACCDNAPMGEQIEHLRDIPLAGRPEPTPTFYGFNSPIFWRQRADPSPAPPAVDAEIRRLQIARIGDSETINRLTEIEKLRAAERAAPSPQQSKAEKTCARCGHYDEVHGSLDCVGWMPAGTGHTKTKCSCTGFVRREAAPRSPARE